MRCAYNNNIIINNNKNDNNDNNNNNNQAINVVNHIKTSKYSLYRKIFHESAVHIFNE